MSAAVLEKMRTGGGGLQLRLPVGSLRPVAAPDGPTPPATAAPVTDTSDTSDSSSLPKFQFAFGQSAGAGAGGVGGGDKCSKSVPTSPRGSGTAGLVSASSTPGGHGRDDEGLAGRLGSLLESAGIGTTSGTGRALGC